MGGGPSRTIGKTLMGDRGKGGESDKVPYLPVVSNPWEHAIASDLAAGCHCRHHAAGPSELKVFGFSATGIYLLQRELGLLALA